MTRMKIATKEEGQMGVYQKGRTQKKREDGITEITLDSFPLSEVDGISPTGPFQEPTKYQP